jgi:twitching motility protein PilU
MTTASSDEVNEQLGSFLEHMRKINASDLYLIGGHPPVFRVDEVSYPARGALESDDVASMAGSLMSASQREQADLASEMSVTFPWFEDRFRASIFFQRGSLGMVVRRISVLKTLDELRHGPELRKLALIARGLVLVVGAKRSGRSSTIAALIDHRNTSQPGHILTIEDPIEHLHAHKQCLVTQREIGSDTPSYATALRSAASLAPDLIFVDQIRDLETLEALLGLADAGYACFSTLHADTASTAVERVINFFPAARHGEARARLAQSLRAVVAQRLLPGPAEARVLAAELLLDTPANRDFIRRGDIDMLARTLEQAGMQRPRESGRASAVPLRLAADSYEQPAPVASPPGDRRSRT